MSGRATMRQLEQTAIRAQRERERFRKAMEREALVRAKEARLEALKEKAARAAESNERLNNELQGLESILAEGLFWKPVVNFKALITPLKIAPFDAGPLGVPSAPVDREAFLPEKPNLILLLLPWVKTRYLAGVVAGELQFGREADERELAEQYRTAALVRRRVAYDEDVEAQRSAAKRELEEISRYHEDFVAGKIGIVARYAADVLAQSPYPPGFPQEADAYFVEDSKQLVVEYLLPSLDAIVPTAKDYKFVKSTDKIVVSERSEAQRRTIYASVVAQTVLRSLQELFASTKRFNVETVVLNAYVDATDPSNGKRVRPCLVTVRATADTFDDIELANVDPRKCLISLGAAVSKSPAELLPVRPILELNMVDPRFVQEQDVLSTLDQRPNLMELTPNEFENLITNLFHKMGLETRQTQASRDGGVDCVAFDPRPIFGGKVIIQAKRYKNTVGVSAVRDLFGTLQNEGASKGILVTTSGYGKAAFDFAAGKPIELLSGANLLFLLKDYAGMDAKIVAPEDWSDVVTDF